MGDDPEIKALRQKRLNEFKKRIKKAQLTEERKFEIEKKREQILTDILTDEAYVSLEKLRSINQHEAQTLETQCLQLAMSGYLRDKIDKNLFEDLHLKLKRNKHEPRFIRKSRKGKKEIFSAKNRIEG